MSIFKEGDYEPARPGSHLGGPHGVGDPADRSMRRVEAEVLVPKLMRERARQELCVPEADRFTSCCRDAGPMMVFNCRPETTALTDCLTGWFRDRQFQMECMEMYLKQRAEYRATGVSKAMARKGRVV